MPFFLQVNLLSSSRTAPQPIRSSFFSELESISQQLKYDMSIWMLMHKCMWEAGICLLSSTFSPIPLR